MNNTKKSLYIFAIGAIVMLGFVFYKNLTGDINIEIEDLRLYSVFISLFSLISGIFAGIAVKRGEGKFASPLLTINIGIFIVTFYLGIVTKLLQIPLFG